MQILSVNLGLPRTIPTPRASVVTSIFKSPVAGRHTVRGHNITGDRQADLTVHGGPHKAIYAYPFEHYSFWTAELGQELTPGHFGENLTTEGLLESEVCIADEYRVGTTVLRVTQPRMPCFKLALRFERSDMVKRFWSSGFSGIYFGIVKEGELAAGDTIELLKRVPNPITIAEVVGVYKREIDDPAVKARLMAAPIRGSWKKDISERLL